MINDNSLRRLENEISMIKSQVKGMTPVFKEFIANRNLPLEERWELFCEHGEFILPTTINCHGFTAMVVANTEFDSFYEIQRSETLSLAFLIELIEERQEEGEHTILNINQLKEEILEYGYSAIVYDW